MNRWNEVFKFTFKRATSGKGFLAATIGVTVLLFAILFGVNIIFAYNSDKEPAENKVKTVYVSNETSIENIDFSLMSAANPNYKNVEFINLAQAEMDDKKETLSSDSLEVIAQIILGEEGFEIIIISADDTVIDRENLESIGTDIAAVFEAFKAESIGLSQDQLMRANSYISYQVVQAGENPQTIGEVLFNIFAPMILYLVLYIMLITYGQSISKTIIAEKSSKIMELLLTSVKPYAIVTGKILAMVAIAILQFGCWILGGILGFVIGDIVAKGINPEYENQILNLINLIRETSEGMAFSIPMVIAAILILFFGFFFYCVYAGLIASNISKPEELSNASALFQIPVVVSFLAVYMLPLMGVEWVTGIMRYIPFTAAFILPSDLLIGNMTFLEAVVPLLIMAVTAFVMVYGTGKIYKKKIF